MELLQDPLPKGSGNIRLFDNRSQKLPYMVIYVNMMKIDNLVQNISEYKSETNTRFPW